MPSIGSGKHVAHWAPTPVQEVSHRSCLLPHTHSFRALLSQSSHSLQAFLVLSNSKLKCFWAVFAASPTTLAPNLVGQGVTAAVPPPSQASCPFQWAACPAAFSDLCLWDPICTFQKTRYNTQSHGRRTRTAASRAWQHLRPQVVSDHVGAFAL